MAVTGLALTLPLDISDHRQPPGAAAAEHGPRTLTQELDGCEADPGFFASHATSTQARVPSQHHRAEVVTKLAMSRESHDLVAQDDVSEANVIVRAVALVASFGSPASTSY